MIKHVIFLCSNRTLIRIIKKMILNMASTGNQLRVRGFGMRELGFGTRALGFRASACLGFRV